MALGLIYNGVLEWGFTDMRVASVLAQIGFGYFFAALISLYSKSIKGVYFLAAGNLKRGGCSAAICAGPRLWSRDF